MIDRLGAARMWRRRAKPDAEREREGNRQMMSSWEQKGIPNPGSARAVDEGCLCAVFDNGRGSGFIVNRELSFWITMGCPLHAPISEHTTVWEMKADSG